VAIWPELDLFINHWIIKALAILAINAQNRNNRSRGKQIRASIAQIISAGFFIYIFLFVERTSILLN